MKVGDMTTEEFKVLVGEVVEDKLNSLLSDPDRGLELRHEIETRLGASLDSKERYPLQDVKERLGLL
jgi:hypothetical protein